MGFPRILCVSSILTFWSVCKQEPIFSEPFLVIPLQSGCVTSPLDYLSTPIAGEDGRWLAVRRGRYYYHLLMHQPDFQWWDFSAWQRCLKVSFTLNMTMTMMLGCTSLPSAVSSNPLAPGAVYRAGDVRVKMVLSMCCLFRAKTATSCRYWWKHACWICDVSEDCMTANPLPRGSAAAENPGTQPVGAFLAAVHITNPSRVNLSVSKYEW